MKANDLMIGDWVQIQYRNKKVKVTGVHDGLIDTNAASRLREDEVYPIPLTAEILEKNGFKKKGHRYGIYDDYYDFEMYEYNDGTWIVLYHCCETPLPDEQLFTSYVHQLQHFMHHCLIEKDIII